MRCLLVFFLIFGLLSHAGPPPEHRPITHRSISIPFYLQTMEGTQQLPFHYSYRIPMSYSSQREMNSVLTQVFIDKVRFEMEFEFYRELFLKAKFHKVGTLAPFQQKYIGQYFLYLLQKTKLSDFEQADWFARYVFELVSLSHYLEFSRTAQFSMEKVILKFLGSSVSPSAVSLSEADNITTQWMSHGTKPDKNLIFLRRQYYMKCFHEKSRISESDFKSLSHLSEKTYQTDVIPFLQSFDRTSRIIGEEIIKEEKFEISDSEILERTKKWIRQEKSKKEDEFYKAAPDLKQEISNFSFLEKEKTPTYSLRVLLKMFDDELKLLLSLPPQERAEAFIAFKSIDSFLKDRGIAEAKIHEARELFLTQKNPIIQETIFEEAYLLSLKKFNDLKEKDPVNYDFFHKEAPEEEAFSFALRLATSSEPISTAEIETLGNKKIRMDVSVLKNLIELEKLDSYFSGSSKEFNIDFSIPEKNQEPSTADQTVEDNWWAIRLATGVVTVLGIRAAVKYNLKKKNEGAETERKQPVPPSSPEPSNGPEGGSSNDCAHTLQDGFLENMDEDLKKSAL